MKNVFTPEGLHKKRPSRLARYQLSFLFAGLATALVFSISAIFYSASFNAVTPTLSVVWPTAGVNLFERQILMVEVNGREALSEESELWWELEGGFSKGEMAFDGTQYFTAEVDTSSWDWKKDGTYNIHFYIKGKEDRSFSHVSVPVFTGVIADTEVVMDSGLPVNEAPVNTATVMQAIGPAAPSPVSVSQVAPPPPVASVPALTVDWVRTPARNNQRFTYRLSGYKSSEVTAFWQAGGGHKNFVYETNEAGQFITAINFFGWHWKGKGPYPISFVIANKETSAEIARENFSLTWQGNPGNSEFDIVSEGRSGAIGVVSQTAPMSPVSATATPKPVSAPVLTPALVTMVTTPPPSRSVLFTATKPAVERALQALTSQSEIEALTYIKNQPNVVWLNGDTYETDGYIERLLAEAQAQGKLPAFVLYNIPSRDCGSYSSGGVGSAEAYKAWIDRLATVFSKREAIIVIEPDALPQLNCVPENLRAERLELLRYAAVTLRATSPALRIYIDAGHPFWVNAEEMAERLKKAGVASVTGFSLNVSNFVATKDNITYGNYLSNLLGGKRYVIDTSRNGNGPSPEREWCNPSGRALGQTPTLFTGNSGALDAYLWIKFPGESDGTCAGGPTPGQWWTNYAVALYKNRGGG